MQTNSKTLKQARQAAERRWRVGILSVMGVLTVVGMLVCGYGHAALSTELLVSGGAVLKSKDDIVPFPITYMQDMTPEVCANASYNTESQLTDKRDGKKYWVRKQFDGTCWMVQNLALDITPEGLTSELSDINYSSIAQYEEEEKNGQIIYKWNANSKYPPVETYNYFSNSGSNYTTTRSWNLGEYVHVQLDSIVQCNTNKVGPSGCDQFAYVGETWANNDDGEDVLVAPAYEPTLSYRTSGITYDETKRTYDAHYLIGNYYQYRTATAGSYTQAKNAVNSSSICPKGWRLPTTDNAAVDSSLQEVKLALEAYQEAKDETVNLWLEPMYFVRAGNVESGNYMYAGGSGIYSLNRTYSPYVGGNTTVTTYNDLRGVKIRSQLAYGGVSVRCIARTGLEE